VRKKRLLHDGGGGGGGGCAAPSLHHQKRNEPAGEGSATQTYTYIRKMCGTYIRMPPPTASRDHVVYSYNPMPARPQLLARLLHRNTGNGFLGAAKMDLTRI
jgi:hypothetical protein